MKNYGAPLFGCLILVIVIVIVIGVLEGLNAIGIAINNASLYGDFTTVTYEAQSTATARAYAQGTPVAEIRLSVDYGQTNDPNHDHSYNLFSGGWVQFPVHAPVHAPGVAKYNLALAARTSQGNITWRDTVDISVNGNYAGTVSIASCPQDNTALCSSSITVQLNSGDNTLRLYNESGWMSFHCSDRDRSGCTIVTDAILELAN